MDFDKLPPMTRKMLGLVIGTYAVTWQDLARNNPDIESPIEHMRLLFEDLTKKVIATGDIHDECTISLPAGVMSALLAGGLLMNRISAETIANKGSKR